MLPLEVVFVLIVVIWGLVGAVRGFSKEIGASIVIVLAMAALRIFGPMLISYFNKIVGTLTSFQIPVARAVPTGVDPFCAAPTAEQFIFYTLTFGAIVFMGYQGETLSVAVNFSKLTGSISGLFVGLANGYLIAGNLWYFLDKCARYNVPALGIKDVGVLSPTALTIIKVLPLNLIGEPILLLGLLFLLLILRIAK